MIQKAEVFQKYLSDNNLNVFSVEEVKDSPEGIVVFRSHITAEGQRFPLIVIFDKSIFTVVRVQIFPQARNDENRLNIYEWINEETAKYKLFKFYCAADGSLMLEVCHTAEDPESEVNGDTLYLLFDMIINYLDESYRNIMRVIFR